MAHCFVDDIAWKQQLSRIPAALQEKFVSGIETLGANLGVECVKSEPGQLQVRINGTAQGFFQWLEDAQIVAVELEPADIPALLGRNFDSLVLKRALERGEVSLGRLEPHEIMSTVRDLAWSLQATGEQPTGLDLELAQHDLKSAGLMTDRDFIDPVEPEQYRGFHSSPYDNAALPEELRESQQPEFDPFV